MYVRGSPGATLWVFHAHSPLVFTGADLVSSADGRAFCSKRKQTRWKEVWLTASEEKGEVLKFTCFWTVLLTVQREDFALEQKAAP